MLLFTKFMIANIISLFNTLWFLELTIVLIKLEKIKCNIFDTNSGSNILIFLIFSHEYVFEFVVINSSKSKIFFEFWLIVSNLSNTGKSSSSKLAEIIFWSKLSNSLNSSI